MFQLSCPLDRGTRVFLVAVLIVHAAFGQPRVQAQESPPATLDAAQPAENRTPAPESIEGVLPADKPMPRTDQNSKIAHQELLLKAKRGATEAQIDVYFIGDSITRRWGCTDPQYTDLMESWRENFHGWNAANFAWGGDTTNNILWRLQNGELDGLKPQVFVILAGTNNLSHSPGEDYAENLAEGIKEIVEFCQRKVPQAKIVLTGIFPRNDKPETLPVIRKTNQILASFADGEQIRYLNVNEKLAGPDGLLLDRVTNDGLHLSRAGYEVWADGLRPILTEWLGPPAEEDRAPPPTGDPSVRSAKRQ